MTGCFAGKPPEIKAVSPLPACLEHSEFFWEVFLEILRVLKPTGHAVDRYSNGLVYGSDEFCRFEAYTEDVRMNAVRRSWTRPRDFPYAPRDYVSRPLRGW